MGRKILSRFYFERTVKLTLMAKILLLAYIGVYLEARSAE